MSKCWFSLAFPLFDYENVGVRKEMLVLLIKIIPATTPNIIIRIPMPIGLLTGTPPGTPPAEGSRRAAGELGATWGQLGATGKPKVR